MAEHCSADAYARPQGIRKAPAFGEPGLYSTTFVSNCGSYMHRVSDDLPKRTPAKGWLVDGAFR